MGRRDKGIGFLWMLSIKCTLTEYDGSTVNRYGSYKYTKRGLSIVFLQLKDPLKLFLKRREFLPGSGFLSRRDMT